MIFHEGGSNACNPQRARPGRKLCDTSFKRYFKRSPEVESLGIKVGVFDGYFAKANFVNGITDNSNLEVISKF